MFTSLFSTKVAAAALVVGVVSAATAAYADVLPSSLQDIAHRTIDAPAAHHSAKDTPEGPSATGHAAFGLCTAYAHATKKGDAAEKSVAFRNLVKAAGGAGNVAAFCSAVHHPGRASSHHPSSRPSPRPTGRPASHHHGKKGAHHSHPTGRPSSHPSGPPTS